MGFVTYTQVIPFNRTEMKVIGTVKQVCKRIISNINHHFLWRENKNEEDELEVYELIDIHRESRSERGDCEVFSLYEDADLPIPSSRLPINSTILCSHKHIRTVNKSKFVDNFNTMFQGITEILNHINREKPFVAACGGSVSRCLLNMKNDSSDVDLFIYDVPTTEFREKEAELLRYFRHGMSDLKVLSKLIEFTWNRIKVQIIRRCYSTLRSIIHGFDISACAVAYDGTQVFMTHRALYTYKTGMILTDPEIDRSKTYEKRLDKYFKRGFSILLTNCYIRETGIIALPTMHIDVVKKRYNTNNGCSYLTLGSNSIQQQYNSEFDDYEDCKMRGLSNMAKMILNMSRKYRGCFKDLSYKVPGVVTAELISKSCFLRKLFNGVTPRALDFFGITCIPQVEYNKPHFKELPTDILLKILQACDRETQWSLSFAFLPNLMSRNTCPCMNCMKNLTFKMSFDRLVHQYVIDNPGAQFTSSVHPEPMVPEIYYGQYYRHVIS